MSTLFVFVFILLSMGVLVAMLLTRQKMIPVSIFFVTIAMIASLVWGHPWLRIGLGNALPIKLPPLHPWLVLLLLPAVFLERTRWNYFSLSTRNLRISLLEGGVIGFCIVGLIALVNYLVAGKIGFVTRDILWWADYLLQVSQVAVFEELLMRGFVLGYIRQAGISNKVANSWQGLLFAALHTQYFVEQQYCTLVLLLLLGLCLGHITMKRGTIAGAIVTHFVVNFFT